MRLGRKSKCCLLCCLLNEKIKVGIINVVIVVLFILTLSESARYVRTPVIIEDASEIVKAKFGMYPLQLSVAL